MANQPIETNPHFIDRYEELAPEQRHYIPPALLPGRGRDHHRTPRHDPRDTQAPQDERPQPRQPRDEHPLQPPESSPPEHHPGDGPHIPLRVWVPPPHHEGQQPHTHQGRPSLGIWAPQASSMSPGPAPKKQKRHGRTRKEKPVAMQPQLQDQHPRAALIQPQGESIDHYPSPGKIPPKPQGRETEEHRPHSRLFLPSGRRTKPAIWFAAAFCIIFWLAIIIGGLIVLIVYLVFRPRIPRFDVIGVTLNAAYLDMGYLLNADVTVLANFTNPNKKVRVDFSYMYLDLYFDNTIIATQYIPPFSAARGQSMFANIHMVTSQVSLSIKDTMLLQKQIENNRVMLAVKGVFRARSNFGRILKYSYWLHGDCSIMVSSPPTGVLKVKKCKTKH